ncbi:MAG: flagellar basal body-associated FliL family protein [Pyrinomonadaceae bacterium]
MPARRSLSRFPGGSHVSTISTHSGNHCSRRRPQEKQEITYHCHRFAYRFRRRRRRIFFYTRANAATKEEEPEKSKKTKGKAKKAAADDEKEHEESEKEEKAGKDEEEEHDSEEDDSKVTQVIELQPFVVNLADQGEAHYLRLAVSVGVSASEGAREAKKAKPTRYLQPEFVMRCWLY